MYRPVYNIQYIYIYVYIHVCVYISCMHVYTSKSYMSMLALQSFGRKRHRADI